MNTQIQIYVYRRTVSLVIYVYCLLERWNLIVEQSFLITRNIIIPSRCDQYHKACARVHLFMLSLIIYSYDVTYFKSHFTSDKKLRTQTPNHITDLVINISWVYSLIKLAYLYFLYLQPFLVLACCFTVGLHLSV